LFETPLNNEIENRIFQEVDSVLGNKEAVDYDDTTKLGILSKHSRRVSVNTHQLKELCLSQPSQRNLDSSRFLKEQKLIAPSTLLIISQKIGTILNISTLGDFQVAMTKTGSPISCTFHSFVVQEFALGRYSRVSMQLF